MHLSCDLCDWAMVIRDCDHIFWGFQAETFEICWDSLQSKQYRSFHHRMKCLSVSLAFGTQWAQLMNNWSIKCGKIGHCSCQRDVLNFVRFKLIKDPNLKTFFVWNMNEIRKQFEESSIKPISHEFSSLQSIYAGSMDHVWGGHPGTGAWRLLQLGLDHGLGQTCRSLWPTWQVELLVGLSWEWRVGLEGPACCQLCAFS